MCGRWALHDQPAVCTGGRARIEFKENRRAYSKQDVFEEAEATATQPLRARRSNDAKHVRVDLQRVDIGERQVPEAGALESGAKERSDSWACVQQGGALSIVACIGVVSMVSLRVIEGCHAGVLLIRNCAARRVTWESTKARGSRRGVF
jgi:lysozyme family protein